MAHRNIVILIQSIQRMFDRSHRTDMGFLEISTLHVYHTILYYTRPGIVITAHMRRENPYQPNSGRSSPTNTQHKSQSGGFPFRPIFKLWQNKISVHSQEFTYVTLLLPEQTEQENLIPRKELLVLRNAHNHSASIRWRA